MVTVLPGIPSFGEKLAGALGQGIADIGKGYIEGKTKQHDAKIFEKLATTKDLTPMQEIQLYGQMSAKGQEGIKPFILQKYKGQTKQDIAKQKREFDKEQNELDRENALRIAQLKEEGKNGRLNQLTQDEINLLGLGGQIPTPVPAGAAQLVQGNETQGQINPEEGQQPQNPPPAFDITKVTDDELVRLRGLAKSKGPQAVLGAMAEAEWERRLPQKKEQATIAAEERELGRSGAKTYIENIEKDRVKLPEEQFSNQMILNAVKSGEVDPWSKAHLADIARGLGAPEALTTFLESPGSKEFKTARKTFIGNTIKDAFRGTTTKIEIDLAEDVIAEVGVTIEANLASTWAIQAALDIKQKRLELYDKLKEEGVEPSKLPARVEKELTPYRKQLKDQYFEAIETLRKKK